MQSTNTHTHGFPYSSAVKNPPANAGDTGWIPGLERSLGEGNGNPLQYSCLGNPMDRGACWATVHGVTKSQTRLKRLSRTTKVNLLAYSRRISVGETAGRDGCQKVSEALLERGSTSERGHGEPTRSGSHETLRNGRGEWT